MGLILPSICPDGSHFAQNTTNNSCPLLSSHTTLVGICTYTKHPKIHPKTPPFPDLNLKVGKMTYHLGNLDKNVWKVGKTFLEVSQKIFIHAKPNAPCWFYPVPTLPGLCPWQGRALVSTHKCRNSDSLAYLYVECSPQTGSGPGRVVETGQVMALLTGPRCQAATCLLQNRLGYCAGWPGQVQ